MDFYQLTCAESWFEPMIRREPIDDCLLGGNSRAESAAMPPVHHCECPPHILYLNSDK